MQLIKPFFMGALLAGCTATLSAAPMPLAQTLRTHTDLLSGGLGLEGLRKPSPPPAGSDAESLRIRALWTNWRGIADLAPGGGYGEFYGKMPAVPGREYSALLRFKGNSQPHRVMVQIPDNYDLQKRCLVLSASSGSRGIYGAIALAGGWGLNHGCAVAYTDKGAGTGFLSDGYGFAVDGTLIKTGAAVEFSPSLRYSGIAVKHAHSGDNPEAEWGRYLQQLNQYALATLASRFPEAAPFTPANTRTLAVGVSNGGGAVLRAAELPGNWLDGVVAISPNIHAPGSRPLYDYSTEAALLMPCALNAQAFDQVFYARPVGQKSPAGFLRCNSLAEQGVLQSKDATKQAEEAWALLQAGGWTAQAVAAGAVSTTFDLWRAVAVTYASAYLRTGPDAMPCGYRFDVLDAAGKSRAVQEPERALWWSDSSGIPPGNGVGIVDALAKGTDPYIAGLQCLRALWTGSDAKAKALRRSISATQAKLPSRKLPVLVIHGLDDGLVPEAHSSGAYVRWAQTSRPEVRYWQVQNAQHFDAFLAQPVLSSHYVPMMPYAYRGLDALWSVIAEGATLPENRIFRTTPRPMTATGPAALQSDNLGF
jgi:hydroxybutyrate-dimer hydrolase